MALTRIFRPISRPSAFKVSSGRLSLREFSYLSLHQHSADILRSSTFQILFYAIRPAAVRAQKLTGWHYFNLAAQLVFDALIVWAWGSRPLVYFVMSSFLAGSLHPCAGHFIAEHYVWDGTEQETYSYYGPLNILTYNVCRCAFSIEELC